MSNSSIPIDLTVERKDPAWNDPVANALPLKKRLLYRTRKFRRDDSGKAFGSGTSPVQAVSTLKRSLTTQAVDGLQSKRRAIHSPQAKSIEAKTVVSKPEVPPPQEIHAGAQEARPVQSERNVGLRIIKGPPPSTFRGKCLKYISDHEFCQPSRCAFRAYIFMKDQHRDLK